MGDEVQAIKAGLLEVADIVVVNKGDRPGAQRPPASCGRCSTVGAQHDRAAAEAAAQAQTPRRPARVRRDRRRCAGLLAALDRRDAPPGRGERSRRGGWRPDQAGTGSSSGGRHPRRATPCPPRDAGGGGRHGGSIAAVAAHEIDPYAAADRALDRLMGTDERRATR